MWDFRGGLELLLEKSTKVHEVDVQPKDGQGKVCAADLLDRMPLKQHGATAYRICCLVIVV